MLLGLPANWYGSKRTTSKKANEPPKYFEILANKKFPRRCYRSKIRASPRTLDYWLMRRASPALNQTLHKDLGWCCTLLEIITSRDGGYELVRSLHLPPRDSGTTVQPRWQPDQSSILFLLLETDWQLAGLAAWGGEETVSGDWRRTYFSCPSHVCVPKM